MTLTLKRVALTLFGVFGVLLDAKGVPFALTLERPWLNNAVGSSCIPAGEYVCKRVNSPKFGSTFEVVNVPGRTEILLHKGNLMEDSHGCILIGEQFEPLNGQPGVLASAHGFSEFLKLTAEVNEFELSVKEC